MDIRIRTATTSDIPAMELLIERSVRGLQAEHYTAEQIDRALRVAYGIDSQLVTDGTYFAVESSAGTTLVACGGWSRRTTLHGSDRWAPRSEAVLDPRHDAAKIRAFYVDPTWARRGIGSQLLQTCETAARAAGCTRFEIGATLTGALLYTAHGYRTVGEEELPLGDGVVLRILLMEKSDAVQA